MPYQVEETGKLTRTASVTIPSEEYEQDVNQALRKLSGRVKVRGFRKGKIPLSVMKQRYGDAVQQDVIESLIRKYIDEIVEQAEGVIYIDRPEVTKFAENGVGLEFRVDFELRPEVDPIGYLGLEVEKPRVEVTQEELEEQLERLREQYSALEPIEHRDTIASGDVVTFDFEALGDDEALEQFKGEDAQVVVGEGQALPGIDEALEGAKFNTTVTASVETPEDFQLEELQGKSFEIQLTIKSVKRKVLPELDDDFAVDTGEAETLLELRQKVREEIASSKEHQAAHIAEDNLIDKLLEQNDFDLPPRFVEEQVNNELRQQLQQFARQGISPDQLGLDLDELRANLEERQIDQLRAEFLLMAIADKESLDVQEDDLRTYFEHQAQHMGATPAQLAQYFRQDPNRMRQAMMSALLEKTVRHLLDEATIKEVDWPTPEEQAEKAEAKRAKKAGKAKKAKKAEKAEKPEKAKKAEKAETAEAPAETKAEPAEESAPAASGGYDEEAAIAAFEQLTVDELKDLCRDNDLKVSGRKAEIIDRLLEAQVSPPS